jgi:hypothetical protein
MTGTKSTLCLTSKAPCLKDVGERRYSSTVLDLGARWVVTFTSWSNGTAVAVEKGARLAPGLILTLWTIEKFHAPLRNQTPPIQPIVHHYTNWAVSYPGSILHYGYWKYFMVHCKYKRYITVYIEKWNVVFGQIPSRLTTLAASYRRAD